MLNTTIFFVGLLNAIKAYLYGKDAIRKNHIFLCGLALTRIFFVAVIFLYLISTSIHIADIFFWQCVVLIGDIIYMALSRNLDTADKNYTNITKKYEVLRDNPLTGTFVTNIMGELEYANSKFCSIFEIPGNDISGKNILDFIHPDYKKIIAEALFTDCKVPKKLYYDVKGVKENGDIINIRILGSITENGHTTVTGSVMSL